MPEVSQGVSPEVEIQLYVRAVQPRELETIGPMQASKKGPNRMFTFIFSVVAAFLAGAVLRDALLASVGWLVSFITRKASK